MPDHQLSGKGTSGTTSRGSGDFFARISTDVPVGVAFSCYVLELVCLDLGQDCKAAPLLIGTRSLFNHSAILAFKFFQHVAVVERCSRSDITLNLFPVPIFKGHL